MKHINPYNFGFEKNDANYVPLSPLTFLERSAFVYPDRISVIHGEQQYTWAQTYDRCRRLASALTRRGVAPGDTVATMLPNVPAMYEAHFGVPMTGAVLNTLNTRMDAEAIAFMLQHGEAKVLLTDREFSSVIEKALKMMGPSHLLVIDVDDVSYQGGKLLGEIEYEALLEEGDPAIRLVASGGRVECHRAELHVGHHRQPQGRGLSPPRRLPQRGKQHHLLGHAAARRLSVDPADVPL